MILFLLFVIIKMTRQNEINQVIKSIKTAIQAFKKEDRNIEKIVGGSKFKSKSNSSSKIKKK